MNMARTVAGSHSGLIELTCRAVLVIATAMCGSADAQTKTWDGKYDTTKIEVTVVYFVPSDRVPLVDWRDRVDYYCGRIRQFHLREFQGQSELLTVVHPEPMISDQSTAELRAGDANAIFFRTLREAERRLQTGSAERSAFPILLVLSEINWRPLDDFYRLRPGEAGFEFEGLDIRGLHFPGATSGGARATYPADRGVGWGLVSADGWRVPYRGCDCVVYHEGCGHTVGLPHPDPIDPSVMGTAQYEGWISETFINRDQKIRLGWQPQPSVDSAQLQLFTDFTATHEPRVPAPGDKVRLRLTWPGNAEVRELRVRFQTSLDGPWIDVPQSWQGSRPDAAELITFDRETPVSWPIRRRCGNRATGPSRTANCSARNNLARESRYHAQSPMNTV